MQAVNLRHLPALFEDVEGVFLDLHNGIRLIHPYTALKMQIETSIVEIDRSDSSDTVIAHEGLRMKKSRLVLEYTHSGSDQLIVIRSRKKKYELLIRYTRRDDPHIDAAFCSETERRRHFVICDQIRRKNIDVFFRTVDNIQINRLADCLMIKRRIPVRLYKTVAFNGCSCHSCGRYFP